MYSKNDILKGLFWSGVEKFGFVFLQILLEIVLARLLLPKDYGIMGIVMVFTAISVVFAEGGFTNALINKQDRNEIDFSTVFYSNLFISLFIYFLIFIFAPFIENFFGVEHLSIILKVVMISLVLNASILVHKTKLTIAMNFKLQAKLSLIALIISGCIGIYLAYKNFGVWSLIYQYLSMTALNSLLLWIWVPWFPKRVFSLNSLSSLFSFGSKILIASAVQTFYFNAFSIVIGKFLGTKNLGLYSKSNQFTVMPASTLTNIGQRVLFPFFSSYQGDKQKLFELNQLYTKICCLLFFPFFFTIAIVAEPLVLQLLSNKWKDMVPLFTILCFGYVFYPFIVNNMMIFQIKNKTTLFLKVEIFTKLIGLILLIITIQYGLIAIIYGILIHYILQLIMTAFFANKILEKSAWKQIQIIIPFLIFSFALFFILRFLLQNFIENTILKILVGSFISIIAYFLFYFAFYQEEIKEIKLLIRKSP